MAKNQPKNQPKKDATETDNAPPTPAEGTREWWLAQAEAAKSKSRKGHKGGK